MKRKLFLLLCALLTMIGVQAREDVTNTYLTNAGLKALDGWTIDKTQPGAGEWDGFTAHNTSGAVPVIEFYHTWSANAGTNIGNTRTFDFSQTAELPQGYYRLKVNGFYREGNNNPTTNQQKAYIFAGEKTQYLVGFQGFKTGSGNDIARAASDFSNGYYENSFDFDMDEAGSIQIGFHGSINTYCSWCIIGPVTLYKYEISDFTEDFNAKKAQAEALYNSPMSAAVLAALKSAANVDQTSWTTKEQITAAESALNTAIENANISISAYAPLGSALTTYATKAASLDANGQAAYNVSEIQTAYENGQYINEDIASAINNVVAAYVTAVKAQTTPGSDMTGAIVNPQIEGSTGWTCLRPNGGNGPLLNNVSFEYWGGNATGGTAGGSFDYYQTITGLPAGKYTVSAEMYNSTNNEEGAVFSATSGVYAANSSNTNVYKLVDVDGTSLIKYTTGEINVTDGTLRIGVKNQSTMTARWFVADNFKLTLTAAPDLSDFVEAYEAALSNANAVNLTAKMSTSALSALQNALSTYGNVDKTSISAMTEATTALNSAAAAANISIASYAVIADGIVPDNKLDGWVCENTNTFHINTWSVEGNPGNDPSGMVTPFIENWVGKGSLLGAGKVYYQLKGLNPGEVYYAQALVRSYNEASADAPNGPNFFINDKQVDMTEAGTTFTYNNMSGIYATLRGAATVGSDGTLTLGVEIADNRNYNWVAFKSISIRPMKDALKAAIESVEATIPAVIEIGDALFQYDATAVEARQSKISTAYEVYNNSDATLAQMEAQIEVLAGETTAIPQNAPDANKAYYLVQAVSGLAADLGTVKLSSEASPMFFAVEGNGYKISKDKANFVAYAGGNTWTLNTTTDGGAVCSFAYIGEGKYSITSTNGSFGTDNTTDGSSIYGNKPANAANSAWYIYEGAANLKVANGKLGTFVAPFNVVLPQNVKGYIAKVDGSEVKLTKIAEGGNELTAGTPVIVYADGADVDETFYGIPTEDWTLAKAFDLWGILAESSKNVPVGAYVLQTQGGIQAFYKVTSVAPGALNRCYIAAGVNAGARLTIKFDDTTAINAIEVADAEAGALKDGKYLIGGKIVIVKNGVKYSANGQILK